MERPTIAACAFAVALAVILVVVTVFVYVARAENSRREAERQKWLLWTKELYSAPRRTNNSSKTGR